MKDNTPQTTEALTIISLFLDRGKANHPQKNIDETRGMRRSQERREDGDPVRESKRKSE